MGGCQGKCFYWEGCGGGSGPRFLSVVSSVKCIKAIIVFRLVLRYINKCESYKGTRQPHGARRD